MDVKHKKRQMAKERRVGATDQTNVKRVQAGAKAPNKMMDAEQLEKQPPAGSMLDNQARKTIKPAASSARRSSARLQKNQKSTKTPCKPFLVDSAYDGDEEFSPSTSQSDENDPYSVATMEDVPFVPRGRKKKREKQPISADKAKAKVKKQASNSGGHTSSTPNQVVQPLMKRSTRNSSRLSSTPEVTPILPVQSDDRVPLDGSFSTPQIYHLTHKSSPDVLAASPSLQSSSQADSGIALSPPAKKARLQSNQPRHKSAAVLGKKFMNKRNIFNPDPKAQSNDSEAKENVDNLCFGFNNFKSLRCDQEKDFPGSEVYRNSQIVTSDSSPSQALLSTDSENCCKSHHQWPSPGLFSDDMISADSESLTFHKSSTRSYKPSKVKKLKHKKPVSKFEAWRGRTRG